MLVNNAYNHNQLRASSVFNQVDNGIKGRSKGRVFVKVQKIKHCSVQASSTTQSVQRSTI